jgi:mannose-6-phosphate isomerase-like protein (cupin superfamily)
MQSYIFMNKLTPYTEERPWGNFVEFTKNEPSTVKLLTIKAGEALSLQSHAQRAEFWRVVSGDGFVTVGDTRTPASVGNEFLVSSGTKHRIEGGSSDIVILEISTGHFDENDIARFDDRYGRIATDKHL